MCVCKFVAGRVDRQARTRVVHVCTGSRLLGVYCRAVCTCARLRLTGRRGSCLSAASIYLFQITDYYNPVVSGAGAPRALDKDELFTLLWAACLYACTPVARRKPRLLSNYEISALTALPTARTA